MFFQFNMIPNLVCKIVKRELMNSVIPYVSNDVTMGEDVDFTCQLITRAISVNIVASTQYHYVQTVVHGTLMYCRIIFIFFI